MRHGPPESIQVLAGNDSSAGDAYHGSATERLRKDLGLSWTSETSSNGQSGAIMTPSLRSPARPSRGWTRRRFATPTNDGTRLLITGCYRSEVGVEDCPSALEVVPVNGSGPVVSIDVARGFPGADGTSHVWAPDDLSIITTPLSAEGTPMGNAIGWDALTGRARPVPWTGAGGHSWQRLAP